MALTLSPKESFAVGTNLQPKHSCPNSSIHCSTILCVSLYAAGSRGINTTPTPYAPNGGNASFIPASLATLRINLSGIWVKIPAPSPAFFSAPTAPLCSRFVKSSKPFDTISWDCFPFKWATNPTPHASCSNSGS